MTPGTYRLIDYTGVLTGSAANLVAAPSSYSISFDSSTPGQINMIVSGGAPANLVWQGFSGPNWDVNITPNWLNGASLDMFRNGDNVRFDDSGNGLVPISIFGSGLVNTVVPGSVTVDAARDYTLTGGRLAGSMTLTKKGSGQLTLTGSSSSLVNYFEGPVIIEGGRLRPGYARALGTTNGATIVRSGGTFDVNGLDLGFEPISIEGDGANGVGALVNYGGGQNNALRFVTMTGNATIGGLQRFDIRNVEGVASLSTGGNAYNLTKIGTNQFSLVGVVVDPALGEVDVREGVFGFETSSTLGDASKAMTLRSNAILRLWGLTTSFYKPLVLNGGTLPNIDNGSGANTIIGPVSMPATAVWSVAGTSLRVSSEISGPGGLTKIGAAPLYLDAANSYAGPTVISAGSIVLGASASLSSSSISLASGTTFNVSAPAAGSPSGAFEFNSAIGQSLSGSGTVVGNIALNSGSTIIPGTSAGTLTCQGSLTLDGVTAIFELGATTNAGGNINDLIVVTNNLALKGTITLRINALAPLDHGQPLYDRDLRRHG